MDSPSFPFSTKTLVIGHCPKRSRPTAVERWTCTVTASITAVSLGHLRHSRLAGRQEAPRQEAFCLPTYLRLDASRIPPSEAPHSTGAPMDGAGPQDLRPMGCRGWTGWAVKVPAANLLDKASTVLARQQGAHAMSCPVRPSGRPSSSALGDDGCWLALSLVWADLMLTQIPPPGCTTDGSTASTTSSSQSWYKLLV